MKFETANIEQVLEFIEAKGLLRAVGRGSDGAAGQLVSIKATGGGAFKYAELFEVSHAQPSGKLILIYVYYSHTACSGHDHPKD